MSDILCEFGDLFQNPQTPSIYEFSEDEIPDTPINSCDECVVEDESHWTNSVDCPNPLPLNNLTMAAIDGGSYDYSDYFTDISLDAKPPMLSSQEKTFVKVEPKPPTSTCKYPSFPPEEVKDFKHVIYNLLVEAYNHPGEETLVQPITYKEEGELYPGFKFLPKKQPEKRLPELYALHIRKARLDIQDQDSVFVQDLYKYYLRACTELLGKYFDKRDKYIYTFDGSPLFQPNESLDEAKRRLNRLKTRSRKRGSPTSSERMFPEKKQRRGKNYCGETGDSSV